MQQRFLLDDPLKQRSSTKDIAGYIDENGCWICDSHAPLKNSKDGSIGYFKVNRVVEGKVRQIKIHRYAYETLHGIILDPETVLRHNCDNAMCVNPHHMQTGTHAENVQDRVERERSALGEVNGRSKITEDDVRYIRASKETKKVLSEKFNVDPKVIYNVQNGLSWKHVK